MAEVKEKTQLWDKHNFGQTAGCPGEVKSATDMAPAHREAMEGPSQRILMNFSIPEACQ